MKKKNGFVFAETIIVVSILSLTLLMLYSSYAYILRKTKEKKPYDTIDTIYKTYYVKEVIEKNSNGSVLNFVRKHNKDISPQYECTQIVENKVYSCDMNVVTDKGDTYGDYNSRQHDLESVGLVFKIDKYYYIDIEYIKNPDNKQDLLELDATTIDYINNISSSTTGNYLVVKYVVDNTTYHSAVEVN